MSSRKTSGLKGGQGIPPQVLKFVLLGDAGVGKSSLVTRFCDNRFIQSSSTVGVDFKWQDMEIEGDLVRLHLWDTAGQEKYRVIAKPYYRQADGVVLVYDCTSMSSMTGLASYLADVRELCPLGALIVLLGNKCDVDPTYIEVPREAAESFAKQNGISMFFETSAKQGTRVDEAFRVLARHVCHAKKLNPQAAHKVCSVCHDAMATLHCETCQREFCTDCSNRTHTKSNPEMWSHTITAIKCSPSPNQNGQKPAVNWGGAREKAGKDKKGCC